MPPERWRELERVYLAALERDSETRARFLATECHGDEELRREVEELLEHEEQSKNFIEVPALEIAAKEESVSLAGAGEFRFAAGSHLGPYEILQALGAGGMGEIYSARDTRLGRIVALKVVSWRIFGQEGLRDRLKSEAQAISRLNHPNICTLHDIGCDDGVDYLVMEYVVGETLAERLKRGPLALEQLRRTTIEICEALDYAHRNGVIHRDLKPGNIMLTDRGAKLLDFGLARWREEAEQVTTGPSGGVVSSLTLTGFVLGTPQYMAPEQIERREVDQRTDVFALGAVIYEMATGKKAFDGRTPSEVTRAVLEGGPREVATEGQGALPGKLRDIIGRCLEKSPENRWQSVGELRQGLVGIGDLPVTSRPKWILGVTAAAVITIVSAGVWYLRTHTSMAAAGAAREEIIYTFKDPERPGWEIAGLVRAPAGDLYGVSRKGGVHSLGQAFKLVRSETAGGEWRKIDIHDFAGGADGAEPTSAVTLGPDGSLYGGTQDGGKGNGGVVFRLTPSSGSDGLWTETILHEFSPAAGDGREAGSGVTLGPDGALYGTTQHGGGGPGDGCGIVYRLIPPSIGAGAWREEVLYRFKKSQVDGAYSWSRVVFGKDGLLYGTTFDGGGGVFSLKPAARAGHEWQETVLHRFNKEHGDGFASVRGVIVGKKGELYGTTQWGGWGEHGIVYEMIPPVDGSDSWREVILYHFGEHAYDGVEPASGVVLGERGELYGVTVKGGAWGMGTVFELDPPSRARGPWTERILYEFTSHDGDGAYPASVQFFGEPGVLFGTTTDGGTHNTGTVFRLTFRGS